MPFMSSIFTILFAIVILGGSGNIAGVLLGAFLLVGLQDAFRGFESARMLAFGAAMMLMMIFRPQGLLPPRRRHYGVASLVGRYPSGLCEDFSMAGRNGKRRAPEAENP